MIELLLLIGIVYWIGTEHGDEAGTIALAVLVVCLLIALFCAAGKGNRAVSNFIDEWADKDRRK